MSKATNIGSEIANALERLPPEWDISFRREGTNILITVYGMAAAGKLSNRKMVSALHIRSALFDPLAVQLSRAVDECVSEINPIDTPRPGA